MFDWAGLAALIPGQWERVIASVLLVMAGFLVAHLWSRYLSHGDVPPERRRLHLVWARNVIWSVVLFAVASVWASTIAGFALSLAAVAGAMLIVSKELLQCILGYGYLTFVRPFKIGDVIELGPIHGRVIDVDMLATTLSEYSDGWLPTGRTVAIPNALLLATPVRNTSSTGGNFVLHFMRIPVAMERVHDLEEIERVAADAAVEATKSWQAEAEAHFRQASDESFVDLPSGRIRTWWDFGESDQLHLCVRLACPEKLRLRVGQEIFRATWGALSKQILEASEPRPTDDPRRRTGIVQAAADPHDR